MRPSYARRPRACLCLCELTAMVECVWLAELRPSCSHAEGVGERGHRGRQAGQDDVQLHGDVPGEELDQVQGTESSA